MMNRLFNLILLFTCCMIHAASKIDPTSPPPQKETCSLNDITLKAFIPKVTLHSLHHNFSLIDSYLGSHKVNISFTNKDLTWDVSIPGILNKPQLIAKDNTLDIKMLALSASDRNKTHSMEMEDLQSIFYSKEFLSDVISSLQRHKDAKEIGAIFHPGKKVSVHRLQKKLFSSLEFKVLSQTENKSLDLALVAEINKKKELTKLLNSHLQKEKFVLSPNFHLLSLQLNEVRSKELMQKKEAQTQVYSNEDGKEISLLPLGLPSIISNAYNSYRYIPSTRAITCAITEEHLKTATFKAQDHISLPISADLNQSTFSQSPITFEGEGSFVAPEKNAINRSYLSFVACKAHKKNLSAKKQYHLPTKNIAIATKRLGDRTQFEKHVFEGIVASIPSKEEMLPIESIEGIAKEIDYTPLPNTEKVHYSSNLQMPLTLEVVAKDYTAKMNMRSAPSDKLIVKGRPAKHFEKTLITNGSLKEIALAHENLDICIKETPISIVLTETITASPEVIASTSSINLNLLQTKKWSPHLPVSEAYALENDKNISFVETYIGKLCSLPEKNKDLYYTKEGYNFLSINTPLPFSKVTIYKNKDSSRKFLADKESKLLAYKQVSDDTVNSKIEISSHESFHDFNALLHNEQETGEMIEIAAIAKEAARFINIPSELEISPYGHQIKSEITNAEGHLFPNISPLQTGRIYLESAISIEKARFLDGVSLPRVISLNNKKSFFLNPLLSLINSQTYNIETDTYDTASKTNRNHRMTQYSLFNWPTLEELQTDSLPEAFTLDTRIISDKGEATKDFACTIKTFDSDMLQPLPVHVLYILDTSSSIEPHRFKIFKESIIKSIDYLDPNARFNIALLKKGEIELLQENSSLPTISARGFAKRALRKVKQSGIVSFDDLSSLIDSEKSLAADDITHRLCILLSDGKFSKNIRVDQEYLRKNEGTKTSNFSFYTASVSDKNNKAMLSLLAKLNHGFSLYTRTHSTFPRKFSLLVKHLQHPLMHDITISFPDDDDAKVYLGEKSTPILLADKSFTFYGNNEAKTSRIFIQGKSGDRWINILKELPLSNARAGRRVFQRKMAQQKTFLSLYSFLHTKDEQHLIDAKEHVSEYNLELPLQ